MCATVPTIKPHRPADLDYNSSKHRGLTPQQVAENFSKLERVWDDIVDENVVFPTRSGTWVCCFAAFLS